MSLDSCGSKPRTTVAPVAGHAGHQRDGGQATPELRAPLRPRRRPARHYMSRRAAGAEAPRRGRTLAAHGVAFSEARPCLGAAPILREAVSELRSLPSLLRTAPRTAGRASSIVWRFPVRHPRGAPPWRRWGGRWRGGALAARGAAAGCRGSAARRRHRDERQGR